MNRQIRVMGHAFAVLTMAVFISPGISRGQEPEKPPVQGIRWPEKRTAYCLGYRVRLRSSPDLSGEIVKYLAKGDSLFVLGESTFTSTIDGRRSVWYRLRSDAPEWVFGGYLSFKIAAPIIKGQACFARYEGNGRTLITNEYSHNLDNPEAIIRAACQEGMLKVHFIESEPKSSSYPGNTGPKLYSLTLYGG